MSDIRYSEYPRYPEAEDTVNNFYRFSKTWAKKKKILYDKAWNLKTQDQFIELRDLANKPFSDELLKILNQNAKVIHFKEVIPSANEIFINSVKNN